VATSAVLPNSLVNCIEMTLQTVERAVHFLAIFTRRICLFIAFSEKITAVYYLEPSCVHFLPSHCMRAMCNYVLILKCELTYIRWSG